MRLWSIHPGYLDSKGLVALWRESLLAQNVLAGRTTGYKNHPQLIRFKETSNPEGAIASYLRFLVVEADRRGYRFDRTKIRKRRLQSQLSVTSGQLEYEFSHLLSKLKVRAPERHIELRKTEIIKVHPLFFEIGGNVASWEVKS